MTRGLCFTSGVITFDQNWHLLYSTSTGGKDLSGDTQSRVIGSMKPEICTEILRNLSEKLKAKFPATTHGYSMAKIACLNDAFSEVFERGASPVEGQSLQKEKERQKKFKKQKS